MVCSSASAGPAKLILMTRALDFPAQSRPLRMFRLVPSEPAERERMRGEHMHRGRSADELAMRRDHARDAGAVRMRLVGRAGRIERRRDDARKIGMGRIDRGVDHRDQHMLALGERMRLRQVQLGERILRRDPPSGAAACCMA